MKIHQRLGKDEPLVNPYERSVAGSLDQEK
jgi:hypothetical protein